MKHKKPKPKNVLMRVSVEARKKILNWMHMNRMMRPADALDHMLRTYASADKGRNSGGK